MKISRLSVFSEGGWVVVKNDRRWARCGSDRVSLRRLLSAAVLVCSDRVSESENDRRRAFTENGEGFCVSACARLSAVMHKSKIFYVE